MPTATKVSRARKSTTERECFYCDTQIKEGDTYYYVSRRGSDRTNFCAKHPPRPSDLMSSEKLATLYGASESVEDAMKRLDEESKLIPFDDYKAKVSSALDEAATEAREVGEEYRESFQNMPENFQFSSDLEEKADSCDSWADMLEGAVQEIDDTIEDPEKKIDGGPDLSAYDEIDQAAKEALDSLEL